MITNIKHTTTPFILFLFSIFLCAVPLVAQKWSMIVVADWHGAESFVKYPDIHSTKGGGQAHLDHITYINKTFGGDLVMMPGDSNTGIWYTENFIESFSPNSTPQEVVLRAGKNCYTTMRELYRKAGYEKILIAVGDHELGGNQWGQEIRANKVNSLLQYRQVFVEGFNKEATGEFRYQTNIGEKPPNPKGTVFEFTSYAHRHKNVLFITVDVFKRHDEDFFDRANGLGGEGVISCSVDGKQLQWFENVLIEAKKNSSIKHIFVQSHIPIVQPVRKVSSSGQFMDYGEDSKFWKIMVKYGVDIYFAGEVHTNTVTRDSNSSLLQVVSRGNWFNNFLKISVTDKFLRITAYNERGTAAKYNQNYEVHGTLTIDKSGGDAVIDSTGVLKLLDRSRPLLHMNFEKIVPISDSRQVIGLKHDDVKASLHAKKITIRGIECRDAFMNQGTFGQQYDAHAGNINLLRGIRGNFAAGFTKESRLAFYSNSPHSGGNIISYTLWFKTQRKGLEMILIHFGNSYGASKRKNIYTVTLKEGTPILYIGQASYLKPKEDYNLNDSKWHHVAVSMPKQSCRLSQVVMYIDGKIVETIPPPQDKDHYIFFSTSGRLSLGGFGLIPDAYEEVYQNFHVFIGRMDQFMLWSKTIEYEDLRFAMQANLRTIKDKKCQASSKFEEKYISSAANCRRQCKQSMECWGCEVTKNKKTGGIHCLHFTERPVSGRFEEGASCAFIE